MRIDWIKNLKVGDTVFRYSGSGLVDPVIAIVSRVTKTQVEITYSNWKEKYNLNGNKVGDKSMWHRPCIHPYDQTVEEEIKLRNRRRSTLHRITDTIKVKSVLNKLSEEDLNRLDNLLESFGI